MSARFVDYWENYAIPHDDKSKEYLEPEDFMIKGKYSFLGKSLKLSGKSKFNSDKGLTASNDYSLTHTLSPLSSYMLTHKPNQVTLDGNFKLYTQDNIFVSLYSNVKLEQNAQKRDLPSKLHVRFHHDNNKIFSVGVENLDLFKSNKPEIVSASGLIGGEVQPGVKVFGGFYSGFNLNANALAFQKYLLAINQKELTAYLEVGINRVVTPTINAETKVVTETVSNQKSVNLRFDSNVSKDLKVGGDLAYNFDSTVVETKVFAAVALDNDTTLRVKVQNDNSVTVGLSHNYRNLVNFGFVSKFNFVAPVISKETGKESSKCHLKTKFGLTIELNDTLI